VYNQHLQSKAFSPMRMSGRAFGRCAGGLAILAVLLFWVVLALPGRWQPAAGGGSVLGFLAGSVALSILAWRLDSKWWLLVVGVALLTLALFFVAAGA
jgi:hypothetical protein